MDIKLDSTGDLDFVDGELSLTTGVDAISQELRQRLLFFLGEWFLDQRLGVDWFGVVLLKKPNMAKVEQMIRAAAIQTSGIKTIRKIDFDFNVANRSLSVEINAETEDLDSFVFSFSELLLPNFQRTVPWPTA
jgi:hypothetical protein